MKPINFWNGYDLNRQVYLYWPVFFGHIMIGGNIVYKFTGNSRNFAGVIKGSL